jgi:HAD superfamily hydrolase (TIGR01509 family)
MILSNPSRPIQGGQVILFDLDGTLRHNRPEANNFLFDYVVSLGAMDSTQNRHTAIRWAHYYWAHSPELQEDVLKHVEMDEAFWEQYMIRKLQAFGCPVEQAIKLAPIVSVYMDTYYEPEDWIHSDVPDILAALRAQGYRLGLVTNRSFPVDDYLEDIGLAQFFEVAVAAGEIQVWKPDPGIYRYALALLQATPEQAVYVGDNYYADVIGAERANIRPILYDPEKIFEDVDCEVVSSLREINQILTPTP